MLLMPRCLLSFVPMQNLCLICSNHLFRRIMILTTPGLIFLTISSCFLSKAVKILLQNENCSECYEVFHNFSLYHLFILITIDLLSSMKAIINSWEMSHVSHSYMSMKAADMSLGHSDFYQSQFLWCNWPLTKTVFYHADIINQRRDFEAKESNQAVI